METNMGNPAFCSLTACGSMTVERFNELTQLIQNKAEGAMPDVNSPGYWEFSKSDYGGTMIKGLELHVVATEFQIHLFWTWKKSDVLGPGIRHHAPGQSAQEYYSHDDVGGFLVAADAKKPKLTREALEQALKCSRIYNKGLDLTA